VRIRRPVATGLPYGATAWGICAGLGDAAAAGAAGTLPPRAERPDLRGARRAAGAATSAADRLVALVAPAPLGHG